MVRTIASRTVVVAMCAFAGSIARAHPLEQGGQVAVEKPPTTRGSSDNAATAWRNIFPHINTKNNSALTQDDWDAIMEIAGGNPPPTQKKIERGRVAMSKLGPVLDDLVSTSKLRKCDFEYDYSQGFGMPMPELAPMRQAARILGARANLALADGDWETYLDTADSASNLSLQIAQSPVLISSLVSKAVGGLAMSSAQQLVDEGQLTPEKAAKLLEAMDPMRGVDPHGYSAALNEEYKAIASSAMSGNLLADLFSAQGNDQLKKLNAEEVQANVLPLSGLYAEMSACFLEPNKDAAMKRLNAALATMDSLPLKAKMLMRVVMPEMDKLLNNFFEQQARIDALMSALQGIASGKVNAGALGVPAIWWSRAAAAARALNDEQQDAVEMLRLGSVDNASPLIATAITTLDASDTTVFECMRRAMACENKIVSFEKISRNTTPLDLALSGGLRGAARMALAKSKLPTLSAEQSLGLICMAIAASNALTSDPTFTHALCSQSIVEEIAGAIGGLCARGDMTVELRGKLDLAIATIPRSDAFGFRAAIKKTRAELAQYFRGEFGRVDVSEELSKALAQKSAQWLFAVDILYRSSEKPAPNPEGTLVGMEDLFPPDFVQGIAAAWETKQMEDEKAGNNKMPQPETGEISKTPNQQLMQKVLNKINPPAMRDISLDMNRVGEALRDIDAAVASRPVEK